MRIFYEVLGCHSEYHTANPLLYHVPFSFNGIGTTHSTGTGGNTRNEAREVTKKTSERNIIHRFPIARSRVLHGVIALAHRVTAGF